MESIKGLRKLERKLDRLAKSGSKKVARAAVTGAVAPIRKEIRRGVNGSTASADMKRAARKTIGSSVKKQKGGGYGASFGKHGENIEVVIYCDDCADTELVYHKDLIARDCDFEIYGLKIKE